MNKPTRKELPYYCCRNKDERLELTNEWNRAVSYNQAITDYEKWLPSEREVARILFNTKPRI